MEPRAFEGIAVRAGMFALWNLTSTEHRDQVYRSFCAAMQSALDAKDFETASAFRDLREMLTENYMPDTPVVHATPWIAVEDLNSTHNFMDCWVWCLGMKAPELAFTFVDSCGHRVFQTIYSVEDGEGLNADYFPGMTHCFPLVPPATPENQQSRITKGAICQQQ